MDEKKSLEDLYNEWEKAEKEETGKQVTSSSQESNKSDMRDIEVGHKKCPFCAETIKIEAIVCRYCSRDLPQEKQNKKQEKVNCRLCNAKILETTARDNEGLCMPCAKGTSSRIHHDDKIKRGEYKQTSNPAWFTIFKWTVFVVIMFYLFTGVFSEDTDTRNPNKEYYSWSQDIDKKDCDTWGQSGINDGIKDRADGTENSKGARSSQLRNRLLNKVGYKMSASGIVAEIVICYEGGYDIGYYQ